MTNDKNRKDKEAENVHQKDGRKPYVKPQIVEHGRVEELTKSGSGPSGDAGAAFRP